MSTEQPQCQAITKAGERCKNKAKAGSIYCGVHAALAETVEIEAIEPVVAEGTPSPASSGPSPEQTAFSVLLTALNQLAQEMQHRFPEFIPPSYSAQGLRELVSHNVERITPDIQSDLLSDLKSNIEGTSPKDLVDPETWKGLWYILNYVAQAQTESAMSYLSERLSSLPGMDTMSELASNLEGTSPKDFVDPETWKGLYLIVNYTVRGTASDLKRKLMGDNEDE